MNKRRVRGAIGSAVGGMLTVAGLSRVAAQDEGASVDPATGDATASSGGATVSIVNGEAVITFDGDDEDGEESGDEADVTLDESHGTSIADASGGNSNLAFAS